MVEQRQAGPGGQHRVQAERQVGGIEHFFELGADHFWHAHAPVLRGTGHANPAISGECPVGIGEAVGGVYLAGLPAAALLVATAV
ncbi:hypothetical protein D3C75_852480 [compost metagenome]